MGKNAVGIFRIQRNMLLFLGLLGFILFLYPWEGAEGARKESAPFVPKTPCMAVEDVVPGMRGFFKTVVSGTSVESVPVEVLDVISRKEKPHHLILVKASGAVMERTGGVASGMSGSPVYVEGKLLGAIGYGWEFSDHRFALVTSIEDMVELWSRQLPEEHHRFPEYSLPVSPDMFFWNGVSEGSPDIFLQEIKPKMPALQGDGFSPRSIAELEKALDIKVRKGLFKPEGTSPVVYGTSLKPGEALGALLAWGDISLGAIGTVTAVDAKNRFIAFAHPFLNRGAVSFPVTAAYIHSIIPSMASPFKLGSMGAIVGVLAHDTAQGIGGIFQTFAPSVSFNVEFRCREQELVQRKRFHVADDAFILAKVAQSGMLGLLDTLWGQKGEGTAFVDFHVDKTPSFKGWHRENIYFSREDITKACLEDLGHLVEAFTTNGFFRIFPLGFSLTVEISESPRVLFVEEIFVPEGKIVPGKEFSLGVGLRPYRGNAVKKKVILRIPEAYQGPCEVVVRGGGIGSPEQEALLEGWKSITSMDRLLKELDVLESNNEVVVELVLDDSFAKEDDQKEPEHPFLSDIVKEKLEEKTLRIFRTNYYVEGLLRKKIEVGKKPRDSK